MIPQTVSFENFSAIFNDPRLPYGTWFVNSLTVALVAAIFSTLMSVSAAFAFSRLRFKDVVRACCRWSCCRCSRRSWRSRRSSS